jgi:hypothetical protein
MDLQVIKMKRIRKVCLVFLLKLIYESFAVSAVQQSSSESDTDLPLTNAKGAGAGFSKFAALQPEEDERLLLICIFFINFACIVLEKKMIHPMKQKQRQKLHRKRTKMWQKVRKPIQLLKLVCLLLIVLQTFISLFHSVHRRTKTAKIARKDINKTTIKD